MAYNPFTVEEARYAYFDSEQVIILDFWVERVRETGMLVVEPLKLGIILEERVVEPSFPELKGADEFSMWFIGRSSEDQSLVTMWDITADLALDLDDDANLHDLAMIHHQLALKVAKQNGRPTTELSEGSSPNSWLKQGACLASSCGMEGHMCGTGHCLNTLSEQHRQLAQLYGRLSMSDKIEMELIADCDGGSL